VDDQVLTPTFTRDLAEKIKEVLRTHTSGLYHITNQGECSWYAFACKIFDLLRMKPDLTPTSTEAHAAKARRPSYSVLGHGGLMAVGVSEPRPWTEALRAYLEESGHL
jgi:dTDP-4-dehydrorhamnose reductase